MGIYTKIISDTYYDSASLMKAQKSLSLLPEINQVGVMMGTDANKKLLLDLGLGHADFINASAQDLLIVIKSDHPDILNSIEETLETILLSKNAQKNSLDYMPKSLEKALAMNPASNWVVLSVAGQYAISLAKEALDHGKNVFLFSDNISLEDEKTIKSLAQKKGLFVLGPDCGTAIINGIGFGFSNTVPRGDIGVIAASGTGLQQFTVCIQRLGEGISQAIGTGGRDLHPEIAAITTKQSLSFLRDDENTEVITLISKPPELAIIQELIQLALSISKPIVIYFIGFTPPSRRLKNIHFALSLSDAAELSVKLRSDDSHNKKLYAAQALGHRDNTKEKRGVRALFSGGTLAYEFLTAYEIVIGSAQSNLKNKDTEQSLNHVTDSTLILDLGADDYTQGRLHPMMDQELRLSMINEAAKDATVTTLILDLVLGIGVPKNPAQELAEGIIQAKKIARDNNRELKVIVLVVGTDLDTQILSEQVAILEQSFAIVVHTTEDCITELLLPKVEGQVKIKPIVSSEIHCITLGLTDFYQCFLEQEVPTTHVDWRPPANGNPKLMALLDQLK